MRQLTKVILLLLILLPALCIATQKVIQETNSNEILTVVSIENRPIPGCSTGILGRIYCTLENRNTE